MSGSEAEVRGSGRPLAARLAGAMLRGLGAAGVCAVALACAGLGGGGDGSVEDGVRAAEVRFLNGSYVNVRSCAEPDDGACPPVAQPPLNTPVTPTGETRREPGDGWTWHQVRLESGATGWVREDLLREQPVPEAELETDLRTALEANNEVNVRAGLRRLLAASAGDPERAVLATNLLGDLAVRWARGERSRRPGEAFRTEVRGGAVDWASLVVPAAKARPEWREFEGELLLLRRWREGEGDTGRWAAVFVTAASDSLRAADRSRNARRVWGFWSMEEGWAEVRAVDVESETWRRANQEAVSRAALAVRLSP